MIRIIPSLCLHLSALLPARAAVDFNRVVRPLLSDNCFACHGPDIGKRKAELRLDERAGALAPAKSGKAAIVPGKPDESELVKRLFATDPDGFDCSAEENRVHVHNLIA